MIRLCEKYIDPAKRPLCLDIHKMNFDTQGINSHSLVISSVTGFLFVSLMGV